MGVCVPNFRSVSLLVWPGGVTQTNTRESRCLAGEPKHFPFADVFVFIIKITLKCHFLRKAPCTFQSDFLFSSLKSL